MGYIPAQLFHGPEKGLEMHVDLDTMTPIVEPLLPVSMWDEREDTSMQAEYQTISSLGSCTELKTIFDEPRGECEPTQQEKG